MIEQVQINQMTEQGPVVIHPETTSSNVLHGDGTIDKIVTLDGVVQTNFNFIENKVVQDGLVLDKSIDNGKDFTIQSTFEINSIPTSTIILISNKTSTVAGFAVTVWKETETTIGVDVRTYGTQTKTIIVKSGVKLGKHTIVLSRVGNIFKCTVDDTMKEVDVSSMSPTNWTTAFSQEIKYSVCYNRPLTSQEIQHNFSVLNNSLSTKELHTTDSTGKTSILKLASNEDHVEMSTGRTLREEYMGVLKPMGKEFVSADGSPIQVPNGIEARVIEAEIKGQTVKNIAATNNTLKTIATTNESVCRLLVDSEANKTYTIVFIAQDVIDNTKALASVDGGWSHLLPAEGTSVKNGLNVFKITPSKVSTGNNNLLSLMAKNNAFKANYFMVLEGDFVNKITSYIPFGLHSTKAIISNNGQQYPIYEPTIQGKTRILDTDTGLVPTDPLLPPLKDGDVLDLATKTITFANKSTQVLTDEQVKAYSKYKKVISLPFSEDKVTLNGDGSATWVDKSNCKSNSELVQFPITNAGTQTATVKQYAIHVSDVLNSNNQINSICDNMNIYTADELIGFEKVGISSMRKSDAGFIVSVASSEVGTGTIEEFRQWLADANFNILYKTINKIQTHIPKEFVPTILTHNQTNILEVGGAVKPSSFKVTVPVDKLAEIEARLQALESTTVDVVLNK